MKNGIHLGAWTAACVLLFSSGAPANDVYWESDVSWGLFESGWNWSTGVAPGALDTVIFDLGVGSHHASTTIVNFTESVTNQSLKVDSGHINFNLLLSGSTYTLTDSFEVSGNGNLSIWGGTFVTSGSSIGSGTGTARVDLTNDATWNEQGLLSIGDKGRANLRIQSGTLNSQSLAIVGSNAGVQGIVHVSGSNATWNHDGALMIGEFGHGLVEVGWHGHGGKLNTLFVSIANAEGSKGELLVGSGTWNNAYDVFVGGDSAGPAGNGVLRLNSNANVNIGGYLTVHNTGTLGIDHHFSAGGNTAESVTLSVGGMVEVDGTTDINMVKVDTNPIFSGEEYTVLLSGNGIDLNEDKLEVSTTFNQQPAINNLGWTVEVRDGELVLIADVKNVMLANISENILGKEQARVLDILIRDHLLSTELNDALMGYAHTPHLSSALRQLKPNAHEASQSATQQTTIGLNQALANEIAQLRSFLSNLPGVLTQTNLNTGGGMNFASTAHDPELFSLALGAFSDGTNDIPATLLDDSWGGFARAIGISNRVDSASDRVGYRTLTGGLQGGIDKRIHPDWLIGASIAYAHTDLNLRHNLGGGNTNTLRIGPYVSWTPQACGFFLDTSLTYGFHRHNMHRNVNIGTIDETARSSYNSHDLSLFTTTGYDIELNEQSVLTPFVSLQYTHAYRESFSESGSPSANLSLDSTSTDSLRSVVGGRFAHMLDMGTWTLVPEASVGWAYEYLDRGTNGTAQFAGTDAPFTIRSGTLGRNSVQASLGASMLFSHTLSGFLRYEGDFQSGRQTHAVIAGLGYRF